VGGSGGGGGGGGLASVAGGFLGMKTPGALFVDLARSRTVQDALVTRFELQKVYRTRYQEDACKALDKQTVIEEDRKSGVISITVSDHSRQRAQAITDSYVQELDRLVAQVSTSSARRERVFIEQRMAAVKADLESAEQQFSEFASKNTALDIKEQAKAEVEAASILQGQLIAAESELQGLEAIYTENNVRVRSLRARVQELKNQLRNISGTDASLSADPALSSQDAYPSIRKLPLLGVRWADLYRRVKIQETVYELLNQQYELTRIQEAKEIPTIRVIDPANFPEKKSWPPRLVVIMLLTVLAAIGTVGWIIGSHYWSNVDPDDQRKVFALRVWDSARRLGERILKRVRIDRVHKLYLRRDRQE
jgi:capsule polysaccharide export protein KpsE/RkpR